MNEEELFALFLLLREQRMNAQTRALLGVSYLRGAVVSDEATAENDRLKDRAKRAHDAVAAAEKTIREILKEAL